MYLIFRVFFKTNIVNYIMANNNSSSSRKRRSSNIEQEDNRVKTGPKFGPIWEHFTQGNSIGGGHYQATCKYCNYFFKQGRPQYLRTHILSYCTEVSEDV